MKTEVVILTRSAFLRTALLASPAVRLNGAEPVALTREILRQSPYHVRLRDSAAAPQSLSLRRDWKGPLCTSILRNTGQRPARIKEVVLFSLPHNLPPETPLYGESFQMLSQTTGTLGSPVDLAYSEQKHYRLPQPADARVVTGALALGRPNSPDTTLLAFTSCRRFNGRFFLRPQSIEVVLDTESLELAPGASWSLEEFFFDAGKSQSGLFAALADRLNANHPPLRFPAPPTGWCSWYCFGPKVTAAQVIENLDVISKRLPALRYVQIDDGYQPAMGDWLETGAAFGGDILGVLKQIRARGFEPAIWVAPFIAERESHLFQQHPDWFMKDADGKPLSADRVTFRGWRRAPWYALDGTHPEVQGHFEQLFHTMRHEWGCTYFKLDANFWGAMHGGRLHDPGATRIEAYRRGMEAIRRGAGDSFLLGCNHPVWGSLGLIHGSRSSGDISRKWSTISVTARENLYRGWQNGKLWWNDPDAIVLAGDLPENEFLLHATAIYASGGMILSGDDLTKIPAGRLAMLRKLLPPTGIAAAFADPDLRVGWIRLPDTMRVALFNWSDEEQAVSVPLPRSASPVDFWTGEKLKGPTRNLALQLPARSARLITVGR